MPPLPAFNTSTTSTTSNTLISTHQEIIYLNYSPRCPMCISAIRAAASLAFDTSDFSPKDIGHSEHRDSEINSVSTGSETGYVPRVPHNPDGTWRIDIMNKYNIGYGARRQRMTEVSPNRTPQQTSSGGIVSDSGLGNSLNSSYSTESESTGHAAGTSLTSASTLDENEPTPRARRTSGGSGSDSSTRPSRIPRRVLGSPSTPTSQSGHTSEGSSSTEAARPGLGSRLLSPFTSLHHRQDGLNNRERTGGKKHT